MRVGSSEEITFWRPGAFYQVPYEVWSPPFGSIEVKLFKVGVISILLRFHISDRGNLIEKSDKDILELVKYPDILPSEDSRSVIAGKLNVLAHNLAREVFMQFIKNFENQYAKVMEILSLGRRLSKERDIMNKFIYNWSNVKYYVGTILPDSPDYNSKELSNTYLALAKTTPAFLEESQEPEEGYLDKNNISSGNQTILIEERSWLAAGSRLKSEPWTFRARIFENIIFSLESSFVAAKVIGRFVGNLDIVGLTHLNRACTEAEPDKRE